MIDGASLLVLALSISFALLLVIPLSIAYFYEKVFKKHIYSYLFIVSGVLFIISFFIFSYNSTNDIGSGLFALGGILTAATSLKLYIVMTGGD